MKIQDELRICLLESVKNKAFGSGVVSRLRVHLLPALVGRQPTGTLVVYFREAFSYWFRGIAAVRLADSLFPGFCQRWFLSVFWCPSTTTLLGGSRCTSLCRQSNSTFTTGLWIYLQYLFVDRCCAWFEFDLHLTINSGFGHCLTDSGFGHCLTEGFSLLCVLISDWLCLRFLTVNWIIHMFLCFYLVTLFAILDIDHSCNVQEAIKENESCCPFPLVEVSTGIVADRPSGVYATLDWKDTRRTSQQRQELPTHHSSTSQTQKDEERFSSLALWPLQETCTRKTRILPGMWRMVGRCCGSELCPSSSQSTSLGSKLDLGHMGGCHSLEAENPETEKLLEQEAKQGKGKRERPVQRKGQACCGCQHTAIAISLHSAQLGHTHPTNTVSCNSVDAAHYNNARSSCGTGCGSHCSDQACLSRFCGHAKRGPRSIGPFGTGSEQAGDSRPAPCDCQSRTCPESSPRAGGIQREAPPALVPTSSGVAENVERPNGWLRYPTRAVSSSYPKSQSGYGSGPPQHTDPQRKSCWETSTRSHCGGQDRRSWSTGRSRPGGTCLAEDFAQSGGSVRPQGMWQSTHISGHGARERDYHGGFRGRKSRWSKAASLCLAIWWSNQTHPGFDNYHWFECPGTPMAETYGETRHARWEVTSGSAPTCLRNAERLPSKRRGPVRFTGVEAYPSVCDRLGAACPDVRLFTDLFSQVDDNFTMDAPFDDFLLPYEAQRQAALHHWTCSLTDLFDSISPDVQSSYLRNSELMTIALHDTLVDLSAPQADEDSDVRTCPLAHAQKDTHYVSPSSSRSPFHHDPLPHVSDRWCATDCPVIEADLFDAPDDDIQESRKPKHMEWSFPTNIRRTLTEELYLCLSADEAAAITKFVTENSHLTTVTIRTYGFQDFSRGQRDLRVPLHRLIHWKDFAADTWKDVLRPGDLLTIIVTPQPNDPGIDLHAIVTSTSHLLDKLVLLQIHPEEVAPIRTVVECTVTSTGYTLLRRAGHDIDMEADYRFRFDDKLYYGFEILPIERGHYWTVRISSSAAALYMQQLSAKRIHPMTWRTWPAVNEDLARILRENEEARFLAGDQTVVGPTTFDDHDEWIRIAQETENGMNTPVTLTVFGLKDVDIGTRRITVASINYRSIEDAILGLWPQFDALAKKIHLVYPKPLETDISHVDVILEFYDLWNPLDDFWKPILQECLQPELDTIARSAHYCPGHVSKENFPLDQTGCTGATEDIDMQVWVRGWPLPHPRTMGVVPGDLIQIRHSDRTIQVEEWIQRFFPQANTFKRNMLDQTANIARRDTMWTFLGQVCPGEPAHVDVLYPQWLRYHDPYFVVQALLEILTYRGLSFHDKVIFPTLNRNATNVTFLFGTPQESQSLVQVTFSAKWNETWSEQFCYMTRSDQTTHEFLRSVNSLGHDAEILHNGRLHEEDQIHLTNGDVLEIELQGGSEDEDSSAGDSSSLMQRPKPSTAPGLTKTHIAGLHLPLAEIAVDMEIPLLENVAEFWPYPHVPSSSVIALHPVSDPPNFAHAPPLPMFVVQRNDDRFDQEIESDVLAVVTVSVQAPHAGQPRSQRFKILWVPFKGTRSNFIDFFRMTGHCRKADVICFLYLNNIIWPESDMALRKIEFGDHLRLQVRTEGNSWCDFEYSEGISRSRRLFASSSPEREPEGRDDQEDEQEEEEEAARSPPSDYTIRSDHRVRQRRSRSRARRRNEDRENDSPTLLQRSLELNAKLREKMSSVGPPNEGKSHVFDLWCTQPLGDWTDLGNFSLPRVPLDDITNVLACSAATGADPPDEPQDSRHKPLHDLPTWDAIPANHQSDKDHDPNRDGFTKHAPPNSTQIDFARVIRDFEWLDTHLFLPTFHLEAAWLPPSEEWISLPWYTPDHHCLALWIYFDGSFLKGSQTAGAGVAAFAETTQGWHLCGFISTPLEEETDSYGAETYAALIAVKFAHDLLKLATHTGTRTPQVHLVYDNATVGMQSMGTWTCVQRPKLGHAVRHLVQTGEQRFHVEYTTHHVYGHQGDPGNEIVDTLARDAAEGRATHQLGGFLAHLSDSHFADNSAWFWLLFRPDLTEYWSQHCLFLPDKPSTTPSPDILNFLEDEVIAETPTLSLIQLKLATANVLSLKAGSKHAESEAWGPARQEALLRQFHDHGFHIFAMQETRLKKLWRLQDDRYIIIKSAATPKGHYGTALFFSRKLPHGEVQQPCGATTPTYFKDEDLSIVAVDPRYVVVRVHSPALKCLVLACHAPHTGSSPQERSEFWQELQQSYSPRYAAWDKILLGDLNCRFGSELSQAVGPHQAETSNKEDPCHDFLLESQIWLPATFPEYQRGPAGTWLHPNGKWIRNDYVGLPLSWDFQECRTWVEEDIDLSMKKTDHCVAAATCTTTRTVARRIPTHKVHKIPETTVVNFNPSLLPDPTSLQIDWHTDVHTHADRLQHGLQEALDAEANPMPKGPLKSTISPETWQLVCYKRDTRAHLADLAKEQRKTVLSLCFQAWTGAPTSDILPFTQLLGNQDRQIAITLHEFRTLGRQVTNLLRRDDRAFFTKLSEEAADHLHPTQTKQIWKVIRRSLPKMRQRRQGYAPHQIECLEAQWNPHFQRLEIGEPMQADQMLAECHDFQVNKPPLRQLDLASLPTLTEIEDALRATKAGKSTGYDAVPAAFYRSWAPQAAKFHFDLIWKMFMWRSEPIMYKGGKMAVLPKKGDLTQAKNYRGILLLPSVPKRIHAIIRKRLVTRLDQIRSPGQIGGLPRQQVMFGSQSIRTFTNVLGAKGYSTAVLFVDLSEAFHRLIREFTTGTGIPAFVDSILEHLHQEGHPIEDFKACLEQPDLLYQLGCDPLLQELVQDIHYHTWYKIGRHDLTRTKRGTRPGSPLADIIFHFLMHDVQKDIQEWITQQGDFVQICETIGLNPQQIIWSDDLAIPWATHNAAELPTAIDGLLRFVRTTFQCRGFRLNLARNKTSVVATFRGPGSPELRRRIMLQGVGGYDITFDDGSSCWLHYLPAYKHLGTYYTADHDLAFEIRCRLGTARAAFTSLAKPVLCNRHLPPRTRFRLFQSLVASQLYFGCGAWVTPAPPLMRKLRNAVAHMCRKIGGWTDFMDGTTTAQVFSRAGIPDPRVVIAQERLRYAMRIYSDGSEALRNVLHQERALLPHSWLGGLETDLAWLRRVSLEPASIPTNIEELQQLCTTQPRLWKRLVHKGLRRHSFQEQSLQEAHALHRTILQVLQQAGAQWSPDPFASQTMAGNWSCPCGRSFTSPQGLRSHQRLAHGNFCLEHRFLSGATCPSCRKFFWTTQRLQQHLAYVPRRTGINLCYHDLVERNYTVDYEPITRAPALAGINRADSLLTEGPFLLPDKQADNLRKQYEQELHELESLEETIGPYSTEDAQARDTFSELHEAITQWFEDFKASGFDHSRAPALDDVWLNIAEDLVIKDHEHAAFLIMYWGANHLQPILDTWLDGQAEKLVEDSFASVTQDFPRSIRHVRISALKRLLTSNGDIPARYPHRPVRRGAANHRERQEAHEEIFSLYQTQEEWQTSLRQVEWSTTPPEQDVPTINEVAVKPHFLVAHLFSGRRRPGDIHEHLQRWAGKSGCTVTVLSLDTANSGWYGDLNYESATWGRLTELYEGGHIAATISGSPCETFSAARAQPPPQELLDQGVTWPRPLRSFIRLFGLDHLTMRELKQTRMGTAFFLQTALALVYQLTFGGYGISEHPWTPTDPSFPSIWRTAILQLIAKHPRVCLHRVEQWRWGATVRKPTGLLAVRLHEFNKSMYGRMDHTATPPSQVAIGRDGKTGRFKTMEHKEYPKRFCEAIAGTICDHLERDLRLGKCRSVPVDADLFAWLEEATTALAQQRLSGPMPDFQG